MSARPATSPFSAASRLALALAFAAGCSEGGPAKTPGADLPKWEGHARELFDDSIDPAAVGLTMDGPSPRSDRFLRERAQTSELVALLKVQTVTVDTVGDVSTYHLGVQVGVPTLVQTKLEERTLELSIKPTSSAFGIAKAFDSRLRGRIFIGFIHRFAGDDGEPRIHWHLSANTKEVADAVKEAVALREVSGS